MVLQAVLINMMFAQNLTSNYEFFSFSLPAELVQSWLDYPEDNAGLLIKMHDDEQETSYVRFCTSDFGSQFLTHSYRPKLTIDYTIIEGGVCGMPGQVYLPADVSGPEGKPDCYVNTYDLAVLVMQWLMCTAPTELECN